MTYFFFYVILNDSEGSHRRSAAYVLSTLVVGYFAYAQYDVLFLLHVILNDSEGSHRTTDRHILLTLVVGYFACAQYDVLFLLHVILNAVKNPTEELTGIFSSL